MKLNQKLKNSFETNGKYINFNVQMGEKTITLEWNGRWEINITKTAKLFNKRWRDWKARNSKVIKTFETLAGWALITVQGPKNKQQTFIDLVLALRVLNDYDPVLSYSVFKSYEQELLTQSKKTTSELKYYREQFEIANAQIAKLKNKPIDINLRGGKCIIYAYVCNNKVKFASSYCNKNGQGPKSHATSVPGLAIGFVIYLSKEALQDLNKAIKKRFKIKYKKHLNCKIDELEKFILDFLKVMNYNYKRQDIHELTKLNIFLAS